MIASARIRQALPTLTPIQLDGARPPEARNFKPTIRLVGTGLTALLTCLLLPAAAFALDPAGESAETPQSQSLKTLFDYVRAGGWVEIVILLASVIAFVAIVDCFLKTRRSVTVPETFLSELRRKLTSDGPAPAAVFCAGQNTLISEALRVGFRRAPDGLQVMEAGAYQALEEGLAAIYLRLALPLGVAIVAPLLGLLGAVLSLVAVFARMMSATPPTSADGARAIIGSLVPFATGLFVSVIVMVFYFFLRRRIARVGIAASVPLRDFLEEASHRRES
jgi:biopolymer transport protein ExbB/TolQ